MHNRLLYRVAVLTGWVFPRARMCDVYVYTIFIMCQKIYICTYFSNWTYCIMCRKRKMTDYHNVPHNAASRWLLTARRKIAFRHKRSGVLAFSFMNHLILPRNKIEFSLDLSSLIPSVITTALRSSVDLPRSLSHDHLNLFTYRSKIMRSLVLCLVFPSVRACESI